MSDTAKHDQQTIPMYSYDSNAGEYLALDKPPKAKLTTLREVEYRYSESKLTFTVIMDETEKIGEGKIIREFKAWVY